MSSAIAHVLTSLCLGGGERVALMLASEQVRRGHRVSVVSLEEPAGGALAAAFSGAGVEVVRVPKSPGFDASLFPRLYAAFRARRVDVAHSHNPLPLVYAAPAAKAAGARTVHTKHGPHPDAPHRLWLRRLAALSTDAFVAVSEPTAAFARAIREVSSAKLRVIVNGVDLARFAPDPKRRAAVRASWGVPDGAFVLGTVGRMAPVKDHALLVRAAAPLLGDGVRLVIAGDGPEAARTHELAERIGVAGWVRLLGASDDVPGVLDGLDLFVSSSRMEGMPLALLEAMAAAVPIVATAVGGVPDTLGDAGLVVPHGEERALRRAIAELMEDPPRAGRIGELGRLRALERFSAARMADDYFSLYQPR